LILREYLNRAGGAAGPPAKLPATFGAAEPPAKLSATFGAAEPPDRLPTQTFGGGRQDGCAAWRSGVWGAAPRTSHSVENQYFLRKYP
jgi:hypothetical protein